MMDKMVTLSLSIPLSIYRIIQAKADSMKITKSVLMRPIIENSVVSFVVHSPTDVGSAELTNVQKGEGVLTHPSPDIKEGDKDSAGKDCVHQATI